MTDEEFADAVAKRVLELTEGAQESDGLPFDAGNEIGVCVTWPWRDGRTIRHAKRERKCAITEHNVTYLAIIFADYFNGWFARKQRDA
jgi:hypothetical protein